MVECRHCRHLFPASKESVGARCPRCRLPLYERVDPPQPAVPPTGDVPKCVSHPQSQALGTCQNCGIPLCAVCRTRWRDQFLCPACVERTVERRPEDARALRRQAVLSVVFGVASWVLVVLGGLAVARGGGLQPRQPLQNLGYLLLLASFVPALVGVGQGAAAVWDRGDRLRLALCGLVVAGSHLGILIGLLLFNTMHN